MSIYIPVIKNYAPFYFQGVEELSAVDIQQQFGVTIKAHEYPAKRKVKQPYRVEKVGADGDDEWLGKIWYEAFTLRLSCVVMSNSADSAASREELKNAMLEFIEYARSSAFLIYDAWTRFGFKDVRISEIPEVPSNGFREKDGRCRLIFDIVLKVNDPKTKVVLSNGVLTPIIEESES